MDLPPELKQGIFLLLTEKELEVVGEVFPDIADDSYFKARYEYLYYSLHECCKNGMAGGLELHLRNTDDVNQKNNIGFTPLHIATLPGQLNVMRVLLNDPRTDVNAVTFFGSTPLHIATFRGEVLPVAILLSDPRVLISPLNVHGRSPFKVAASARSCGRISRNCFKRIEKEFKSARQQRGKKVIYKSAWLALTELY